MTRNLHIGIPHQGDYAGTLFVIVQGHEHHAVRVSVPALVHSVHADDQDIVDRLIHDHILIPGRLSLIHLYVNALKLRLVQNRPDRLHFGILLHRLFRKRLKLLYILIGLVIHPGNHIMPKVIDPDAACHNDPQDHTQCDSQNLSPAGTSPAHLHQRIAVLSSRHPTNLHTITSSIRAYNAFQTYSS